MMGTVMAFTAQPLHDTLVRKLRGHRTPAAAVVTATGGMAILSVGGTAAFFVCRELLEALDVAQRKLDGRALSDQLGPRVLQVLDRIGCDPSVIAQRLQAQLGRVSAYAAQAAGIVVQTATGAVVTLVVALATMYFVLVEGEAVARRLERVLPLDPRDTRALVREFRNVARGAFVAAVLSAIVQGGLAWVGFALGGIPRPLTWAALLAILSFLPVMGTALVWVPAAFYSIATHHVAGGLFIAVWGALVVMAATDYVIRPFLVGSRGQTHPLLTLVSLIGGLAVFGLPGLIAGPVIVSLFVAIARIYERDALGAAPSSRAA
jgi:predicted PurR-regulated permease PerM